VHSVEIFRMDEYRNDDDVFGFLDQGNDDVGVDGNNATPNFGLVDGPSKDAVIFCIDCANFSDIIRGVSNP